MSRVLLQTLLVEEILEQLPREYFIFNSQSHKQYVESPILTVPRTYTLGSDRDDFIGTQLAHSPHLVKSRLSQTYRQHQGDIKVR